MTGYQSKKKAASAKTIDEVNWADHEPDGRRAASVTYNEVADTMNALRKGNFSQKAAAEEVGKLKLYTTPPQRTWVGLTAEEAAECWTTSATQTWKNFEAKLKEKNT